MQRQFTKEGLKKLKDELHELKTAKRQEIAEHLREAASYGDLSENSAYQETKEAQVLLEVLIGELESTVRNALVVEEIKSAGGIEIGSSVIAVSTGKPLKFILVGSGEAAPLEGKISVESPLGRAFLKSKKGDVVEIDTPEGKKKYKITHIA